MNSVRAVVANLEITAIRDVLNPETEFLGLISTRERTLTPSRPIPNLLVQRNHQNINAKTSTARNSADPKYNQHNPTINSAIPFHSSTPSPTTGPINHRLRTANLLELNIRVISIAKPVKAPITRLLPLPRKTRALGTIPEASILVAQIDTSPLPRTAVEDTHPAAGDGKIEMVLAQITPCIRSLNDHRLPRNRTRREGQPVQ